MGILFSDSLNYVLQFHTHKKQEVKLQRVITNDVSDSCQYIYVIPHIICNHPVVLYILIFMSLRLDLLDFDAV
jgi:hypothetical protein